jgi:hypothetical protein
MLIDSSNVSWPPFARFASRISQKCLQLTLRLKDRSIFPLLKRTLRRPSRCCPRPCQSHQTPAREDRRLSLDVDARTRQTAEQDASAALLEGLSVSSEHAAALGTPSTFNAPSLPLFATPANSEATPRRAATRARAHTSWRAPRAIFSPVRRSSECCILAPPPLASRPACKPLGPS